MEIKGAKREARSLQFEMKPLRCVRTWSPWLTQVFRAGQGVLSICPGPQTPLGGYKWNLELISLPLMPMSTSVIPESFSKIKPQIFHGFFVRVLQIMGQVQCKKDHIQYQGLPQQEWTLILHCAGTVLNICWGSRSAHPCL